MTPYMQKKLSALEEQIFLHFKDDLVKWKRPAVFAKIMHGATSIHLYSHLTLQNSTKDSDRYSIYAFTHKYARALADSKGTAFIFGFNRYNDTPYRNIDDKLFPYYAIGFNVCQRLIAAGLLLD